MTGLLAVSLDSMVVAAPGHLANTPASEVVILDVNGGVYHGLNRTGAIVWELLRVPRTIREILDTLLSECGVERSRGENDLVTLLKQLAGQGLISLCAASAG